MNTRARIGLTLLTSVLLAFVLVGCGGESEAAVESSGEPTAQAETVEEVGPLPEEELYLGVLGAGLEYSYQLGLADGEFTIVENMEGYGSLRWVSDDGLSIVVVRRYVEGEPEEWTYVDEGVQGNGVTELSPTGEQLLAWDNLAGQIITATGGDPQLTRGYAWTSPGGIGSTVYATGELAGGGTDDPNLRISFGEGDLLSRADFTLP